MTSTSSRRQAGQNCISCGRQILTDEEWSALWEVMAAFNDEYEESRFELFTSTDAANVAKRRLRRAVERWRKVAGG